MPRTRTRLPAYAAGTCTRSPHRSAPEVCLPAKVKVPVRPSETSVVIRPGTRRAAGRPRTSANTGDGRETTWLGQLYRLRLGDTDPGAPPSPWTTCGSPHACFQLHQAPP